MKLIDKIDRQEIVVDRSYLINLFDRPLSDGDLNFIDYVIVLQQQNKDLLARLGGNKNE